MHKLSCILYFPLGHLFLDGHLFLPVFVGFVFFLSLSLFFLNVQSKM